MALTLEPGDSRHLPPLFPRSAWLLSSSLPPYDIVAGVSGAQSSNATANHSWAAWLRGVW